MINIYLCVCVFSLGFHCCLPGTFQPQSSLASLRHKRKIILKTGLLRYEQTLPCVLFSPVFIIAAKAAETEAENHVGSQARGGGAKVYGTMAPTVSLELPLPKRISCLSSLLYWFSCLKFSCSQGQYNGCNSM